MGRCLGLLFRALTSFQATVGISLIATSASLYSIGGFFNSPDAGRLGSALIFPMVLGSAALMPSFLGVFHRCHRYFYGIDVFFGVSQILSEWPIVLWLFAMGSAPKTWIKEGLVELVSSYQRRVDHRLCTPLDLVQTKFECCGATGVGDFKSKTLPRSCCSAASLSAMPLRCHPDWVKSHSVPNCTHAIVTYLLQEQRGLLITMVALLFAVQLLIIVISIYKCCSKRPAEPEFNDPESKGCCGGCGSCNCCCGCFSCFNCRRCCRKQKRRWRYG